MSHPDPTREYHEDKELEPEPMDMKLVTAMVKIKIAMERSSKRHSKLQEDFNRLYEQATTEEWNEYRKRTT